MTPLEWIETELEVKWLFCSLVVSTLQFTQLGYPQMCCSKEETKSGEEDRFIYTPTHRHTRRAAVYLVEEEEEEEEEVEVEEGEAEEE